MIRNVRRGVCGTLIAAGLAVAGTAIAATPESGRVSSETPRVDWNGEVTGSWFASRAVILADASGGAGSVPCDAPACDSFALEVAEKNDLTVGVSAPETGDQVVVRIEKPDGSYVTTVEDTGSNGFVTVKIKNAAAGAYTVDYWNYYLDGPVEYQGFAQLGSPVAPAPAPGGEPPPGPQPQPTEAIELKVEVGKASARKLAKARRLKARVTVSREVSSVSAVLKKGSKTIGKGRLGRTSGTKTLAVKLPRKKLKTGTYALTVVASDGSTATTRTVKVRVKK